MEAIAVFELWLVSAIRDSGDRVPPADQTFRKAPQTIRFQVNSALTTLAVTTALAFVFLTRSQIADYAALPV